ncbi:nucleotide kinase [Salmonella phage SWJM-03]|uniref:Nucleotide kinase n=1 Tax=Salmonella phage SWJM-03 TaxID=3043509 RepID=A0AAF0H801_9CAUD|nr:nucleotide kinase [Salmonella phage SWJM-03]
MVGNHQDHCRSILSFGACDCGATPYPVATSSTSKQPQDIEGVRAPSHYMLFDDIEAIEVIARSMTVEQFKGYCLGNILKYRLRAGKKSELAFLEKDMAKAGFYGELFEKHKDKCYA